MIIVYRIDDDVPDRWDCDAVDIDDGHLIVFEDGDATIAAAGYAPGAWVRFQIDTSEEGA